MVELDQSDLRVLKDLASSFPNIDLSQLEALLHARASLPDINADSVKPSMTPSSASKSATPKRPFKSSTLSTPTHSMASARDSSFINAIINQNDSGPNATPKRPSKSSAPTRSMASTRDSSFVNSIINENDSSRPTNNHSYYHVIDQSFNNAIIEDSNIQNHSQNTYSIIGQDYNNPDDPYFYSHFTPADLEALELFRRLTM